MAKKMEHKGAKGRHHRAKGGNTEKGTRNEYNAKGAPEMAEAEDEKAEFKKGGVPKKKRDHEKLRDGGHAEGHMAAMRADKKPRGHHHRAAGGRTPYSSGHSTSMPKDAHSGHESERPSGSEGDG